MEGFRTLGVLNPMEPIPIMEKLWSGPVPSLSPPADLTNRSIRQAQKRIPPVVNAVADLVPSGNPWAGGGSVKSEDLLEILTELERTRRFFVQYRTEPRLREHFGGESLKVACHMVKLVRGETSLGFADNLTKGFCLNDIAQALGTCRTITNYTVEKMTRVTSQAWPRRK
jgi:hypothetical protein